MSKFWESLVNAKRNDVPWEHWTFGQILTEEQVKEIREAEIDRTGVLHDGTRSGYKDGAGKQNHQLREYITKENCHKYPELTKIIKELQDKEIRKIIADMVGNTNNFEDAYIRVEVLNDIEGLENPTCEHIAIWLWNEIKDKVPQLSRIGLYETPTSGVVYEGV